VGNGFDKVDDIFHRDMSRSYGEIESFLHKLEGRRIQSKRRQINNNRGSIVGAGGSEF
jgi:hypothetical protein